MIRMQKSAKFKFTSNIPTLEKVKFILFGDPGRIFEDYAIIIVDWAIQLLNAKNT